MRIVLVHDLTLFRQGLKFLLQELGGTNAYAEASRCEEAGQVADPESVQLVLLDYHLPGREGVEALRMMREIFSRAVVVILSHEDDPELIREVIENGAAGFIPKTSTPEVLIAALRLILAGGIYLPTHVLRRTSAANVEKLVPAARPHPEDKLSPRQQQVLNRVIQGKPNKVVARELGISEGTVKAHLSAAFRALGVRNRTEAVYQAAKLGMSTQQQSA